MAQHDAQHDCLSAPRIANSCIGGILHRIQQRFRNHPRVLAVCLTQPTLLGLASRGTHLLQLVAEPAHRGLGASPPVDWAHRQQLSSGQQQAQRGDLGSAGGSCLLLPPPPPLLL